MKYTTKYGQGSDGYRAPELLNVGEAFVTKGSDIWALGCIFYELAYQKKAFVDDIAVYAHRPHAFESLNHLPPDKRAAASIRELICRTIEIDWWKRPTARDVLRMLDSRLNIPLERVFYVGELESESDSTSSSISPTRQKFPPTNPTISVVKGPNMEAGTFSFEGAYCLSSATDNRARNPSFKTS